MPDPVKTGRRAEVMRSVLEMPVSEEEASSGVCAAGAVVSMVMNTASDDAPVFPALSMMRVFTA